MDINQIYLGDCFDLMSKIDDRSIDMVFVDLPYGVTACEWDCQIDLFTMWKNINRIVKKNAVILLFGSQPFTTDLINSNRKYFRYCWYWMKNQGTNFFHAKRMPIRKIEDIVVFYQNQPTYNLQYSQGHIPTRSAKGCSNGEIYYGTNKRNYEGGSTERFPTNILEYNCVNNYAKQHPNEKPVALLEYLIKTYTNEHDVVLDFCCGSGSTCLAAKNTNRNYIGIEKDEKYYKIAKERLISQKTEMLLFD